MVAYPQVDLSMQRLIRFGWKMGDVCIQKDGERSWLVTGRRNRHWIIAQAPSQIAAWYLAWRQALNLERERLVGRGKRKAT